MRVFDANFSNRGTKIDNKMKRITAVYFKSPQNYLQMANLQQKLVDLKKSGFTAQDYLLLLQHFPTFTVGQRIKQFSEQRQLEALGAKFYYTKRGGEITFHGQGQLVGYPILNLQNYNIGVREYVNRIEQVLIDTCQNFEITACRTQDTGVWVGKELDRKIAAIGIQVQRHITSHGFALNCDTDLEWFEKIVPCGLEGKVATSLTMETGRPISIENTLSILQNNFKNVFGVELELLSETIFLQNLPNI